MDISRDSIRNFSKSRRLDRYVESKRSVPDDSSHKLHIAHIDLNSFLRYSIHIDVCSVDVCSAKTIFLLCKVN
jgi:hypothetical protein